MREHFDRHLDLLVKSGIECINDMFSGLLSILKIPAKIFFYMFIHRDIKRSASKSIDFLIDLVSDMVTNDLYYQSETVSGIIEKEFSNWLEYDHIFQYCKKNHFNYPRIEKIAKTIFKWQVIPMFKFLSIKNSNIEHYPELCRIAYENPDDCKNDLNKQLNAINECLKITGKDVSIYNIPFFKNLFHDQLVKLFDLTTKKWHNEIQMTFNGDLDTEYIH